MTKKENKIANFPNLLKIIHQIYIQHHSQMLNLHLSQGSDTKQGCSYSWLLLNTVL